jgi:hypothetical protein
VFPAFALKRLGFLDRNPVGMEKTLKNIERYVQTQPT